MITETLHRHKYHKIGERYIPYQDMMADVYKCEICWHIKTKPRWTFCKIMRRALPRYEEYIRKSWSQESMVFSLLRKGR